VTDSLRFECDLNLNGSTDLYFMPFGKQTNVSLTSPWATPSFTGAYLPDSRTVDAAGFRAQWKVLQYNRNYPQQGVGAFLFRRQPGAAYAEGYKGESVSDPTAFGVRLLTPVDEYQKTMRSAKYAVMFILITFTAFFFVEILDKRRIHPIQYLLVGFAVCLFYLLLLALSEHISFNWAYLASAAAILGMITFYVRYVFQNARLTALFSGILALLYGFYFSLLQLEDYSLLLGTLGLALILGTIMYLTRKVNWYKAYEG
jgi:inner membrane protein